MNIIFKFDFCFSFRSAIPDEIFKMIREANVRKCMKACTEINIAFIPYEEQVKIYKIIILF